MDVEDFYCGKAMYEHQRERDKSRREKSIKLSEKEENKDAVAHFLENELRERAGLDQNSLLFCGSAYVSKKDMGKAKKRAKILADNNPDKKN